MKNGIEILLTKIEYNSLNRLIRGVVTILLIMATGDIEDYY